LNYGNHAAIYLGVVVDLASLLRWQSRQKTRRQEQPVAILCNGFSLYEPFLTGEEYTSEKEDKDGQECEEEKEGKR